LFASRLEGVGVHLSALGLQFRTVNKVSSRGVGVNQELAVLAKLARNDESRDGGHNILLNVAADWAGAIGGVVRLLHDDVTCQVSACHRDIALAQSVVNQLEHLATDLAEVGLPERLEQNDVVEAVKSHMSGDPLTTYHQGKHTG
jgi:hypothetical protein